MSNKEAMLFPKELYDKCRPYAAGKKFPQSDAWLMRELFKLKSNLESEGIFFKKETRVNNRFPYTFTIKQF